MIAIVRDVCRRQDGVAMPVVMGTLMIVTLLAVATAQSASHVNQAAVKDRNAKRALGAAEAGLQVANNRINQEPNQNEVCFIGAPAGAECPTPATGDLGNGATYRYWISQPNDLCGSPALPDDAADQRCVTAIGTVNGVERRLQTRIARVPVATQVLPVPGMVGLDGIYLGGNSTVDAHMGTNGVIHANGGVDTRGVLLGAGGSTQGRVTYTQNPRSAVTQPEPLTLVPVPVADTATVNQNGNWTTSGSVTWTPGTRRMRLNGGTLTLRASGDYNFCQLEVSNSSRIQLAPGVKARIFIDAPDAVRPGSGCPSGDGWGEVEAFNQVDLNYPGAAENFQILVVGWDPASPYGLTQSPRYTEVTFHNQVNMNGLLYAPWAHVWFKNQFTGTGGVAAKYLQFDNSISTFVFNIGAVNTSATTNVYGRQSWRECPPLPTGGTDPEARC